MGPFLSPDPIAGGSANASDYPEQDPVNAFDLDGTCTAKWYCGKQRHRQVARVRLRLRRIRQTIRSARESRRASQAAARVQVSPGDFLTLPWEEAATDTLNIIENVLKDLVGKDCKEAAGTLGIAGGAAGGVRLLLSKGGPASAAVGNMFLNLGAGAEIGALGLFIGSKL